MVFISSQRGISYAAVLPHPRHELLEQGRSSFLWIHDHGWQNTDPSQMFDKPLSPSPDKRRPPAFGPWAFALRQVKAKARNEIVAETLHVDPLSPCPHTQVRSSSKLIPDMLPGKTHGVELLGKRVEMRFETCGFNTSQDARLLEILVKQDASLASRLSARLPGGVYDYADLRSPGSFVKALSLFTEIESLA
jgi:hypothetical protein